MNSVDLSLLDFPTYEDYLESFSLCVDRRYLQNQKFSRMLVTLGYRSTQEVYTKEQFEQNKLLAYETVFPTKKSAILFSYNMTSKDPVLKALAEREKPNSQGSISTIIFLKVRRKSGFEISGYIDYEESLKMANRRADNCVDWLGVFQEKVMLKPSPTNLSYYDWKRKVSKFNDTENYIVMHDVEDGLIFMHRGDHKKICVNIKKTKYANNFSCALLCSDVYGYVILYDHVVRKKI